MIASSNTVVTFPSFGVIEASTSGSNSPSSHSEPCEAVGYVSLEVPEPSTHWAGAQAPVLTGAVVLTVLADLLPKLNVPPTFALKGVARLLS